MSQSKGLDPKIASLLAYVCTPLTAIIFLIIEKENKLVKFHAWQSLFFGLATIVINFLVGIIIAAVPAVFFIYYIYQLAVFGLWILLLVKAYQQSEFKLPVIGDLASKQASK